MKYVGTHSEFVALFAMLGINSRTTCGYLNHLWCYQLAYNLQPQTYKSRHCVHHHILWCEKLYISESKMPISHHSILVALCMIMVGVGGRVLNMSPHPSSLGHIFLCPPSYKPLSYNKLMHYNQHIWWTIYVAHTRWRTYCKRHTLTQH